MAYILEKTGVLKGEVEALKSQGVPKELVELEGDLESFAEKRDQLQQFIREVESEDVEQASFIHLFEELREARSQLKKVSAEYEEAHVPVQYKESAQKKLFEKCMGLEFKITEDRAISLVFTNVHPDNPGQKFTITLDVEEVEDRQEWSVVSLDPAVHGVRVLLNQLNRTHNLTQFCKEIRKKFKESINSTS